MSDLRRPAAIDSKHLVDPVRRLIRSGVPVELHLYPGSFHGFDMAADAQVARFARRDSLAALRRAMGQP